MKKRLFLFCLLVFSITFGLKAQQVNSWEFDSGLEGWTGANSLTAAAIDGSMALNCTGADPSISITPFSPEWEVGENKYLSLRVKNETSDNGGELIIFVSGSSGGGLIFIPIPQTPNDTEYRNIYVDLTTNARWTPDLKVSSYRLDIINGNGGQTGMVYVDYIRFLTEKPAPSSLTIKGLGDATVIKGLGSTLQMLVDVLPTLGNKSVDWSVDSPGTATIDQTGKLTAVAAGDVIVTATSKLDPAVFGSVTITITEDVELVTGITVNSDFAEIKGLNKTLQMSVILTPATATNKNVTYSLDNTAIATIDEVTGILTSVSVGTVTVTATSQDGTNITGTREITVYTGQKNSWEFKYDLEGWTTFNSGSASIVDGTMAFNVTANDPWVNGPVANPAWSAYDIDTMWIRVKNTTADESGELFMFLDAASGGGTTTVIFPLTPNDTEFRDIKVAMTANPKWTDDLKVSFFRLDPIGGSSTGMVYVDFIRFIPNNSPQPFDDRPSISLTTQYEQQFNTAWDNTAFYSQWDMVEANYFTAEDIAAGYLQFVWPGKRVIASKNVYTSPYIIETDLDFSAGSNRAGVVIRAEATGKNDDLQETASGDPGFNREGIAFYPEGDGSTSFIVQFTGVVNGSSTPVTRISVPMPQNATSIRTRGTLRIEDYGSSIYAFYNDAPFIRIELGDKNDTTYTSGTVYNEFMQVMGTFSGMEVEISGKVGVAQRDAALRLYSVNIKTAVPWDNRPVTAFENQYSQVFAGAWDNAAFYSQWDALAPNGFEAADIANGYLQFFWVPKRVICSKSTYAAPYAFETDIDYSAGSHRGGVVLRVGPLNENLQDPGVDPGFNREGIAIYPTIDGAGMIVQLSGAEAGASTPITKIVVPKPAGVTSLMGRGTLRVEDYGTSLYVFHNGEPYIRIDLGEISNAKYSSGTVYNSSMQVMGTFTGMEIEALGKIAVAQRDAALRLYSATIQINAVEGDMLFDKPEVVLPNINELTFTTWDQSTFQSSWDNIGTLGASNVVTGANGHLMLGWLEPRIIATKSTFESPYIVEVDFGMPSPEASGGVVIRVDPLTALENIQEPGEILSPPLFNREGIAFFSTLDGSGMYVQFSGTISEGNGYATDIKRIMVLAPAGINLRDRGVLRIEDYGTSIYVFFNDLPFLRVDLEGKAGNTYTSGAVYNSKMVPQGLFSGMEIIETGKVGIGARQGNITTDALDIYRITFKVPATVPDAPTGVSAVADNAEATVSFTAPENNGGSDIVSYIVVSNPSKFTKTGTASPLVVTGLSNGIEYTFTVFATNEIGSSIPSEVSNSVTPATVPNAPTAITAVAANAQASVSFTAPVSNGGSEITGYTVTSNPGNFQQSGLTSPLVVTGLTNGTAYTFTVIATNSLGNSVSSGISNEVTPAFPASVNNSYSGLKVYQDGTSVVVDLNGLSGEQTIKFYDMLGKCVINRKSMGGEKPEFSSQLKNGIYVIKVQGTERTLQTKFMVK